MNLYSIKVRTSLKDKHISGAERIVPKEKIPEVVKSLLERQNHKDFDFSNVKVERLNTQPVFIEKSLRIKNKKFDTWEDSFKFAVDFLADYLALEKGSLKEILTQLYTGASPKKDNMRGAIIVSLEKKRLEKDPYRGVRTVLTDFIDREGVEQKLLSLGYTARTTDALAVSTKNLVYPDILAEFCISDDEDYTTGYIAVKGTYMRLSPLKPLGLPKGGRVYFVKPKTDIEKLYEYLEKTPVLIGDIDL